MDNMLQLLCHKETPAKSKIKVFADATLSDAGRLWLRYHVECDLRALETDYPKPSERSDGLWQTTCFEIFLQGGDSDYLEFNFAPSGQWAAYHFTEYRGGMTALEIAGPEIGLDASDSHFALEAALVLPKNWWGRDLTAAISCILEETHGTKSYWALAHHRDQPDFHDQACFTHLLKAAGAA
ncbi:DOMON-like domain-containing protein [Sphingorhabdus arenilitoris]|uniref:DOMON-like domain-containing protein n=1 Tax=Sphingorhabdus arenilitoris TaxID=1490041 RepID=A0ABV8RGK0_9SPHN